MPIQTPENSTQAASLASAKIQAVEELHIVDISRKAQPFLYTLTNLHRKKNFEWLDAKQKEEAKFKDFWLGEKLTENSLKVVFKERGNFNYRYKVNSAVNQAATTLSIANWSQLYAWMTWYTAAGEQLLITSVSGNNVTVKRSTGWVAATAIAQNSYITFKGTAVWAGVASTGRLYNSLEEKYNYVQKFVNTTDVDDFSNMTKKLNWGFDELEDTLYQHAEWLEHAALFGQIWEQTDANWKKYYLMGWVLEHAKKGYTADLTSTFTKVTLEDALHAVARYSRGQIKIVWCSRKGMSRIRNLYGDQIRTETLKEVDLTFDSINYGQFKYLFLPLDAFDDDTTLENKLLLLDTEYMKIVYAKGKNPLDNNKLLTGKTAIYPNGTTTTYAKTVVDIVTYMSLELSNSNAFGYITIAL